MMGVSENQIYLDYNATAPLRPEAAQAISKAFEMPSNPSSVHFHGREARAQLETARQQVAKLAGARPQDVTFTSGGTESNNMVLAGYQHIITSAIEHDAVLAASGDALLLDVGGDGVVKLDALETVLASLDDAARADTLVSVMGANNETGIIQPIAEIARICASHNVHIHSDMVQLAGKMPIEMLALGLDYITLSAHKIGGPSGVGAVVSAPARRPAPLLRGGGQEQGRRSGTENMLGIIGFGAAAEIAADQIALFQTLAGWTGEIEQKITESCPEIEIIGRQVDRLGNTSAFYLPALSSEMAVMALDLRGVSISAGSACSSGKMTSSHVIKAMGMAEKAGHVIRVSSGWKTKKADLNMLADQLIDLYKQAS